MIEYIAYAAGALAVSAAALVGLASRRPDTFSYSRSARIVATPEKIFPLINDMRAMNEWNPFAHTDPNMKGAYSGPPAGRGATFDFEGKKCGTGRIEIEDSTAPSRVAMRLRMSKPMACNNAIDFTLEPKGSETVVTWAMSGTQPLMAKIMSCFIDCEAMCGRQFEKGLAELKSRAEAA